MMNNLQALQAQLAAINSQIAAQNKGAVILEKIQKTRVNHRTAAKYFDLQQAYMDAVKKG